MMIIIMSINSKHCSVAIRKTLLKESDQIAQLLNFLFLLKQSDSQLINISYPTIYVPLAVLGLFFETDLRVFIIGEYI